MSIQNSFSDEARALFAERTNNMDLRSDWGRLPPMDIPMHPSQVAFTDDLTDSRFCNERFIESRVAEGNISAGLSIIGTMHNIFFFGSIAYFVTERTFSYILLIAYLLFGVAFCLNMIRLMIKVIPLSFVRFNRQAQLVHRWGGGKGNLQMLSLPWREAVPFTNLVGASMGGSTLLNLLFPTPDGIEDIGQPIAVSGALRFGDGGITGNLDRLEFLRRYMAHGLGAVQPRADLYTSKLTGYDPVPAPDGGIFYWFFYLGNRSIYYFGGGPLISLLIRRAVDNYRWPEEVERLCAEGADLSGIDTTPVEAHPNLFYRYGGVTKPVIYVDAQGRELQ